METVAEHERRVYERRRIGEEAQFDISMESMEAKLVDVSDGGLRFEVKGPIKAKLRMKVNAIETLYDAALVWTKNYSDGHTSIGLEFSHPDLGLLYGEAHR